MQSIELDGESFHLETLEDIDKTIDDLFLVYQGQGRTDLFEEMCPYFGILWPAGKVLATQMAESIHSGEFEKRTSKEARILEIGCGLALPSLLLEKHGWKVEAADLHPEVEAFLKRNRELNQTSGPIFRRRDWKNADDASQSWDLIIASDVLYDKTQPSTLLEFLIQAVSPNGRALIADPGRSYAEGFFTEARSRGFCVQSTGLFGVLIGELVRA